MDVRLAGITLLKLLFTVEMDIISQGLKSLKDSLATSLDVGSVMARNAVAHKWKAPWRSILLREAVAWRTQDLLAQSHQLRSTGSLLGARILLRAAFETVAVLIYLNQSMHKVTAGKANYHEFSERTTALLLGSRNKSTAFESINIVGILKKADAIYPGLFSLYEALSESAHPNNEGLVLGYSTNDRKNYVTYFENKWKKDFISGHDDMLMDCLRIFQHEYDEEFTSAFEQLEAWIEANNTKLEATKRKEAEE